MVVLDRNTPSSVPSEVAVLDSPLQRTPQTENCAVAEGVDEQQPQRNAIKRWFSPQGSAAAGAEMSLHPQDPAFVELLT